MSDKPPRTVQQKIEQKRAELEYLQEIHKITHVLTNQLDDLDSKLEVMSDGAESAALVLSNWQNVVKSVSLASLGLMKYTSKDYETQTPLPECLVRIKLDKDDPIDNENADRSELELEPSEADFTNE